MKDAVDGRNSREKSLYAVLASLIITSVFFYFSFAAALRSEPIGLAAGFFEDAGKILNNFTERLMPGGDNKMAQIDGEAIRRINSGDAEKRGSDFV